MDPEDELEPHEQEFVRRFVALGHRLVWIPRDREAFLPTNDFIWLDMGGIECELKSTKPRYGSIRLRIKDSVDRAAAHGVAKVNFVVDLGDWVLADKLSHQLGAYNRRNTASSIERLWVMSRGVLTEIGLQ